MNALLDSRKKKVEMTYQPSSVDPDAQQYLIETKTGVEMGAGTDAQVHISLFGTNQNIINLALDYSNMAKYSRNIFEAGDTDRFIFYDKSIEKVTLIDFVSNIQV